MSESPSDSVSSRDGLLQNSFYVGINIGNILYGIALLLYFKTIRILLENRRTNKESKSNLFYALFSSAMIFLITIWVATSAMFGEEMWLLDSHPSGGSNVYWRKNISVWRMDLGRTAVILLQLMTDGLMIYRCQMIWNDYRAIIIPLFLWLSTLVLGVLVDWASSSPGGDFFVGEASQFALAYYSVSAFLNTILTCMICYRIVQHGKKVKEFLGDEYASFYFSVITLVIESVLPFTLSGIAFLVSLGVGSTTSVAFISVYFLMMCISPQMLILRVLGGRAWNKESQRPSSTIKFRPGSMLGSECAENNEAKVDLQRLSKVYLPDGHDNPVSPA